MLKDVSAEFSGKKAFEYCKHLAVKIGPRLVGTPGEHKAAEYIAEQFRSWGLTARFQRFPVTSFGVDKATFEVFDRGRWRSIRVEPMGLSQSTPLRGVQGQMVFLPALDERYFGPEMTGCIILACGHRLGAGALAKLLHYKPKAIVYIEGGIRDEPIRVPIRIHEREEVGNLPMARIGHLDGMNIVKKQLGRARLITRMSERKSHSLNVIGEIKGTAHREEIAVICGHYDTSIDISGACDNAAGTAIMMELARIFSRHPSRRTLRFIAFAAEEIGLIGSKFYANELEKLAEREKKKASFNQKVDITELDRHRLVFNLDVHGGVLGQHGFLFSGIEDIGASLRLLGQEIGAATNVNEGPMSSDGSALAAVGIPAVQSVREAGTNAYLHSSQDDIKYLSPQALYEAGAFSELYLRRYVTEASLMPFPREIPESQQKKLEAFRTLKPAKKSKAAAKKRPAAKKTTKAKKARR